MIKTREPNRPNTPTRSKLSSHLGGLVCSLFLLALMGCGSTPVFYRYTIIDENTPTSVSLDAKQRAIIAVPVMGKHGRQVMVCAEPSPDVLTAVTRDIDLQAEQGETDLRLATRLVEAVSKLGERNATIQLLRDGLYRQCEAYLNGMLDPEEYSELAHRYVDAMVTLLAIERITATNEGPSDAEQTDEYSDVQAIAGTFLSKHTVDRCLTVIASRVPPLEDLKNALEVLLSRIESVHKKSEDAYAATEEAVADLRKQIEDLLSNVRNTFRQSEDAFRSSEEAVKELEDEIAKLLTSIRTSYEEAAQQPKAAYEESSADVERLKSKLESLLNRIETTLSESESSYSASREARDDVQGTLDSLMKIIADGQGVSETAYRESQGAAEELKGNLDNALTMIRDSYGQSADEGESDPEQDASSETAYKESQGAAEELKGNLDSALTMIGDSYGQSADEEEQDPEKDAAKDNESESPKDPEDAVKEFKSALEKLLKSVGDTHEQYGGASEEWRKAAAEVKKEIDNLLMVITDRHRGIQDIYGESRNTVDELKGELDILLSSIKESVSLEEAARALSEFEATSDEIISAVKVIPDDIFRPAEEALDKFETTSNEIGLRLEQLPDATFRPSSDAFLEFEGKSRDIMTGLGAVSSVIEMCGRALGLSGAGAIHGGVE